MDINCTLFMQCLHFGIAYVIISRFILKPVLACILEERAKHRALQNELRNAEQHLQQLEAKRRAVWEHAQVVFGTSLKKIPYTYHVVHPTYQYDYQSITDAQLQEYVQKMHSTIMKRVSQ